MNAAAVAAIVSAAMVAIYGALLLRRIASWRRYHDERARRELLASIALFVVALGAGLSSGAAISQVGDISLRRALSGIAFGSFLAAGILFLLDSRKPR